MGSGRKGRVSGLGRPGGGVVVGSGTEGQPHAPLLLLQLLGSSTQALLPQERWELSEVRRRHP